MVADALESPELEVRPDLDPGVGLAALAKES
jgi:hypothetical protein